MKKDKTVKAVQQEKPMDMQPCYCCKKVWKSNEADKFVQGEGKVVCRSHHGVEAWAKELEG